MTKTAQAMKDEAEAGMTATKERSTEMGKPDKQEQIAEQLPMFEDLQPSTSSIKLSGQIDADDKAYRLGSTVYLVVQAEVAGITHERRGQDHLLIRTHKLGVVQAFVMDVTQGRELLGDLKEARSEGGEVAGLQAV